jgi:hypothetical protein
MASSGLRQVVSGDEYLRSLLEAPFPQDTQERLEALAFIGSSTQYSMEDKKRLATWLTEGVNVEYLSQDTLNKVYAVAHLIFGELTAEVGQSLSFVAQANQVSLFSEQPVRHAFLLNKQELFYYFLNQEHLSFEEIEEPLTDYICMHSAEEGAHMLKGLYERNAHLLTQFLETQIGRLRGFLESKEVSEGSIDQFLSLIKFNRAYQMFYLDRHICSEAFSSPAEEAKHVMSIAHGRPIKIMASMTMKVQGFERRIAEIKKRKKASQEEELLQLKEELVFFLERVETARRFLVDFKSLEEKIQCAEMLKGKAETLFEWDTEEYCTYPSKIREMLQEVETLLELPEPREKRLTEEELRSPGKRRRYIAPSPRPSQSSGCVIL